MIRGVRFEIRGKLEWKFKLKNEIFEYNLYYVKNNFFVSKYNSCL